MKDGICATIGIVGGFISSLYGGWSAGLMCLLICMAVDYISGLTVAAVFKKSKKTKTGALESRTCWKGLCRKGISLLIVLVAHQLDIVMNMSYIRDTVIIGFIANDIISILENAGLMGIKLPPVLSNAIDILVDKSKGDEYDKGTEDIH